MIYIEPSDTKLDELAENFPADTPVVMMNLLRFNEQANYLPDDEAEPCSGMEAYFRYGIEVTPMIEKAGGKIVWQGSQKLMVIGPDDKDWQMIVLVEYPTAQAFIDMVTADEYEAIAFHRTAGLADSRLIAMAAG